MIGTGVIVLSETNSDMIIDTLATTFIIEIDQIVFSFTSNAFMKRVLEELPPVRGSKVPANRQTASEPSTAPQQWVLEELPPVRGSQEPTNRQTASEPSTVPQQWLSTVGHQLKKEQAKIGRTSRFGE